MAHFVTFDHPEGGFDFVTPDELGDRESLEERQAALPGGGSHMVHKVAGTHLSRTEAEFPDDYDDNPQAVVHYVQTLQDSHAPKIQTVYGPDPLARKFAVMLGAEYAGPDVPPPALAAPATEVQA